MEKVEADIKEWKMKNKEKKIKVMNDKNSEEEKSGEWKLWN